MGDRRFAPLYDAVRDAKDRASALHALSDTEVIRALAHASREGDPLLANVLATEAENRIQRARVIYENIHDGLLSVDADGRILAVNPAAERMLRWPHNELVGKDKHSTIHLVDDHGRRMTRDQCQMLHVLQTGGVANSDRDLLTRKDGTTFPVSFTAAPVWADGEIAGIVVAFRDATEQTRHEEESKAWLNLVNSFYAVHDKLGMGTVIVDDGRIHYANEAFRSLLGYSQEELRSEVPDVFALFPAETREAFKAHLADLYIHGTSTQSREAQLLRRDGAVVDAELWVARVNHQPGKVSRLVIVVRSLVDSRA